MHLVLLVESASIGGLNCLGFAEKLSVGLYAKALKACLESFILS